MTNTGADLERGFYWAPNFSLDHAPSFREAVAPSPRRERGRAALVRGRARANTETRKSAKSSSAGDIPHHGSDAGHRQTRRNRADGRRPKWTSKVLQSSITRVHPTGLSVPTGRQDTPPLARSPLSFGFTLFRCPWARRQPRARAAPCPAPSALATPLPPRCPRYPTSHQ